MVVRETAGSEAKASGGSSVGSVRSKSKWWE
jgi:hypothetical protein